MAIDREVEERLSAMGRELEELDERLEFAERRVRAIRMTEFIDNFLQVGDLTAEGFFVSSHLDWKLVSSPANPSSGFIRVFADTDNSSHLTQLDSSGDELDLVYLDADAIAAVEGEATLDLNGEVTLASSKSLQLSTDGSGGGVKFGSSGDVILYRGAADKLYLGTGDSLEIVSGNINIGGNLTLTGTVDGVDIATRDHAKYTDAEAISAVEGEATLALSGAVVITGSTTVEELISTKSTLTIDANDEVTVPTTAWVYLTSAGASDNLDGIGSGTEGQVVFLTVAAGKDITLVHNGTVTAGDPLLIAGEANALLDEDHDMAIAIYDAVATAWNVAAISASAIYTDAEAVAAVETEGTVVKILAEVYT